MINLMISNRVRTHPVLDIERGKEARIFWKGTPLRAYENETVASALIANGIKIFGYHKKDHSPQGIFCANGQCAQCMVIIDSFPKKSCMELVQDGMQIFPVSELPELPASRILGNFNKVSTIQKKVLIIGGGPAGISAAIELGAKGIEVLLADDKQRLGGKLILQTHRFFGSAQAVYAGTRGIEIAHILAEKLQKYACVETWANTTAVGVFSDKKVGILRDGEEYILVEPDVLLVTTGAREKFLAFEGNTLPGILGAGAFQTLVNRDLVLPTEKIFIVGGGNVGLIAAYHAVQAGIQVVGLAEVMPECGGYKVHLDKLKRCGVPIFTSHTVISANGKDGVESITIAEVDDTFRPKANSEKIFACDGILLSVGLEPADELYIKALSFGMRVFTAGDAEEISEASAAIFSGKIRAVEIANFINNVRFGIPKEWEKTKEILASKPGAVIDEVHPNTAAGVYPILHCVQKIPCDPCVSLCPLGLIYIDSANIRDVPSFLVEKRACVGCAKCVIGCPGLAITLVDYRKDSSRPTVTVPYEMSEEKILPGIKINAVDTQGDIVGEYIILEIEHPPKSSRTILVKFQAPASNAEKIAGIQPIVHMKIKTIRAAPQDISHESVVCVCENVATSEIRNLIRKGITDLNALKAITRAGMGACGGKTCEKLIVHLLLEEGIPEKDIVPFTKRPLIMEVPIRYFQGSKEEDI